MDERPAPPPEGRLISAALKRAKLSARKAADLAGMSEGRWRQIASGYQSVGGTRVPVHARAETLARMAQAVGVAPGQLEEVGRPDAAEELRNLEPPATPATGDRDSPGIRALTAVWETLTPEEKESVLLHHAHPPDTTHSHNTDPDLTDEHERGIWKLPMPEEERRALIYYFRKRRQRQAAAQPAQRHA